MQKLHGSRLLATMNLADGDILLGSSSFPLISFIKVLLIPFTHFLSSWSTLLTLGVVKEVFISPVALNLVSLRVQGVLIGETS